MARITIKDVQTSLGITETYDIVNAIRNESSPLFRQYVPLANAENVAEVGAGILVNQTLQNEFITSLVDRIGLVVITHAQLRNHLAKFKRGMLPMGRTIEQIFVDLVREQVYDPDTAEEQVFRREIPNVHTLFHEVNRKSFYKQTVQDQSLRHAFINWGTFGDFVSGIINAIYNSAEVDEYKYMKLLIDNYYSKGLFKVVKIEKPDTETLAREFIKKARAVSTKMTLPSGSRDYNALAVHTTTPENNLHLIIDADLNATVDVDVLAKAFNMNKSDFLGSVTIVDNFASTGLEAVLVDRDWFMVYDQIRQMETIRNPQGLYWNYNYHIWQVLSASRFHNAVAFVSGEVAPVTQVIVDPQVASIKAGRQMPFNAYVRSTDDETRTVTWEVVKTDGSAVTTGTTITVDNNDSSKATLVVADTETGQLTVKATVTYESGEETVDVVGEGVVAVLNNQ